MSSIILFLIFGVLQGCYLQTSWSIPNKTQLKYLIAISNHCQPYLKRILI